MPRPWSALDAAARAEVERVPFSIGDRLVGSVATAHLEALAALAPRGLVVGARSVTMARDGATAALAALHPLLRERGLVRAWRGEVFEIADLDTFEPLAATERAASRFWGTLTLGAHANGYVAGADGRPTAMWIAQRAFDKATDPGLFDNLIGGGVPQGQSPHETLVREGFEEAGLSPAQLAGATPGSVLLMHRDTSEGFQHEHLHTWDVRLPDGTEPRNQDGEVAAFSLLPVAEAADLAAGDTMTVDAALVTIDFLLRRRLIADPALATALERRIRDLRVTRRCPSRRNA